MPVRTGQVRHPVLRTPSYNGRVELSAEQQAAVRHLLAFSKPVQTLGGYAGTGKTTVIAEMIRRLPGFAVCAYTGKAANVLRTKGVPATTIHSLIYSPSERIWFDDDGRRHVETIFTLKGPEDVDCEGFLVDEASMVDGTIHEDLRSFNLPIIFVGDHGQLPPVRGSFNLMTSPDVTLETIHRNAGEIARFADFIRQGHAPAFWQRHRDRTGQAVRFTTLEGLAQDEEDVNQFICAFNKTRVLINKFVREDHKRPAERPVAGDKVMCLRNNHGLGLFNGQQGTLKAIFGDEVVFHAEGRDIRVRVDLEAFNRERQPEGRCRKDIVPFDYAYCVTCHKAQGDEWDKVLVLEQKCYAWEHARWAYTAATRARRRLIWVTG